MSGTDVPPLYQVSGDQDQQAQDLAVSEAASAATGIPGYSPVAARADLATWLSEQVVQNRMRESRKAEIHAQYGLDQVRAFRDSIIERYKAHNAGLVAQDPAIRMWQSRPIQLDPNEIAEVKQTLAQVHNALVSDGIEEGVYNDPQLAKLVQVITGDVGLGKPGYYTVGDQPYQPDYKDAPPGLKQLGWLATEFVNPAVSSAWEQIAPMVIQGLTGEDVWETLSTHSMIDDNGHVVNNAGKIPSFNEAAIAVWGSLMKRDVDEEIQAMGLAEAYGDIRREGFDEVSHSVGKTFGMFGAMTATAGPAMAIGQRLARRGMASLLGANRIASSSPWARRFLNYSALSGAVTGNALSMGMMYGHHSSFSVAAKEGLIATVPILSLGALGRKAETAMQMLSRGKMPAFAQRSVSGALQGLGFTGWEMATSPELWNYLRNPNDDSYLSWSQVARDNVLGMALFHAVVGTTPGQYALDRMAKLPETVTLERGRQAREERVLERQARRAAEEREQAPPQQARPAERVAEVQEPVEAPREAPVEKPAQEPPEVLLQEGRRLSFEDVGMGRQEWRVRDPEGRLIAGGSLTVEGKKASIWSAEVREEFRGRGIYPEVIRELQRRFPEGVESIEQTPEAKRAWEKAGEEVSRETFEALGEGLLAEGRGVSRAAEPARQQARIERAGALAEPRRQARRERLHEIVSSRGEFPATGPPSEPVEGVEPIHARDVIAEAEIGPIAPGIRQGVGAARRRWAMGFYSTREDLIRMEGARDLNNLAHEWGHALWEKRGRQMQLSGEARASLLEIGKPVSTKGMRLDQQMHEGMAEFMARHLLGDPGLQSRHPRLYREVMSFLANPEQVEVLGQLRRIEQGFRRWREQGALQQVRMGWIAVDEPLTIQQAQKSLDKPLKKLTPAVRARVALRRGADLFEHAMIDDLAQLRRAQDRAFGKAGIDPQTVPITANPVKLMEALRGKSGAVLETFLLRKAISFGGTHTRGPGLRKVLEEIGGENLEDFITYAYARRSLEALAKGMTVQLPREHYLLAVEKLGNPKFERGVQEFKRWFDHIIDYSVDAGAITNDAGLAIKDSWSVYIPFFRALEGPRQTRPGRGVAERGTGVQRMRTGSQVEIRDPLEAAIEVAQSIIQKAHQAASMKAFYTLHVTTGGVGRFVTEVPRDVIPDKISPKDLAKALDRLQFPEDVQDIAKSFTDVLKDLPGEDALGAITLFSQRAIPRGSQPVVAFVPSYTEMEIAHIEAHHGKSVGNRIRKDNGKLKWLELDKDAYEAVMNIDPAMQADHAFIRALTFPTRLLKLGATSVNPAFTFRNIIRDTNLHAMFTDVQTSKRFVPVLGAGMNFIEGAVGQIRGTGELFTDIGGMRSTFVGAELIRVPAGRRVLKDRVYSPSEAHRRVMKALAQPEATLRVREFNGIRERALKRGATELEANLEALHSGQEISINFIRAGSIGRALNMWVPYFNAGIQGNRKFLRHVLGYEGRGKQKQAIVQGLANITLPSFVLWLLFKDDPEYQDLPVWRRNNYWTLPTPFVGWDQPITVPKPFEAGKFFGNLPEWMLNNLSGESVELSEIGWDILLNFVSGSDFVPSLIGPSIENITNYSFFRGRELVPHWMEVSRIPEDQFHSYTTGFAKWLGKALNVSPIKVENLVSGYTGGLGLSVMRAVDGFVSEPEQLEDPGFDWEDLPGIGTFFRQKPHRQSAAVQEIYDLDRHLSQLKGSDKLSPAQTSMRALITQAKTMISDVRRAAREGKITREDADRRAYEIARPVVEAYREKLR